MSDGAGLLVGVHGASARARKATADRNKRITAAYKAGHSLRAIADAAGLSHSAIAKIVAK